jgi:hypothetical protein
MQGLLEHLKLKNEKSNKDELTEKVSPNSDFSRGDFKVYSLVMII